MPYFVLAQAAPIILEKKLGFLSMRICILNPSYAGSDSPTKDLDPGCDTGLYSNGHHYEAVFIHEVG
jgi:hypothetical protein